MKRLVLHIDRLVLQGFDGNDPDGIAEGLRAELGHLLASPAASRTLMDKGGMARLKVDGVRIGHGTKSVGVGEQVARGITRGIRT